MDKAHANQIYDTAGLPFRDRFAFWREAVCDTYVKLGCEAEETKDFSGHIAISRHSMLSISNVGGKAHRVERRQRDIRAASESFFLLSLQTARQSRITQFGNTSVLNEGDMAVYVSSEPYVLELCKDFSQTVIQLPTEKLLSRLPNARMMAGRKVDGQTVIGKLVRENILAFANQIENPNPIVRSLMQDTLIDLIATGLASLDEYTAELSSPEQHVLIRAKSFIRSNITNPGLDRNIVAQEIGMSVRRLNAIFSKEDGSISYFIRNVRLAGVENDLKDSRFNAMSLTEIAFKNGFSNFQHFSNLFKEHTGLSPRSWREERRR